MDIDAGRVVSRKKEQIRESGNKERSNRRRKGSRVDRWQRCAEELQKIEENNALAGKDSVERKVNMEIRIST